VRAWERERTALTVMRSLSLRVSRQRLTFGLAPCGSEPPRQRDAVGHADSAGRPNRVDRHGLLARTARVLRLAYATAATPPPSRMWLRHSGLSRYSAAGSAGESPRYACSCSTMANPASANGYPSAITMVVPWAPHSDMVAKTEFPRECPSRVPRAGRRAAAAPIAPMAQGVPEKKTARISRNLSARA
jgi:hypothetical protein